MLERRDVIALQRVIGVVDQRSVIDDVAGEQRARRRFPQRDAAGGMAGRVDDLEGAVAQVDDVALVQDPAGGRGLDAVSRCVPASGSPSNMSSVA